MANLYEIKAGNKVIATAMQVYVAQAMAQRQANVRGVLITVSGGLCGNGEHVLPQSTISRLIESIRGFANNSAHYRKARFNADSETMKNYYEGKQLAYLSCAKSLAITAKYL